LKKKKIIVWPFSVILYKRGSKLNSNLIASSHCLHLHLATVVQKDKGRFSFSAKKKNKQKKLVF